MKTEITETKGMVPVNGWIGYDAGCGLCVGLQRRLHHWLGALGFLMLPIQTAWVMERIGNPNLLREPVLIRPDGRLFKGSSVVFEVAREIWWAIPIYWVSMIAGIRPVCRWIYRWFAQYRYRVSDVCQTNGKDDVGRKRGAACLALFILVVGFAVCTWTRMTGWGLMWALAFNLWLALKTYVLLVEGVGFGLARLWFFWPGTDCPEFITKEGREANPIAWWAGIGNLALGSGIFLVVARTSMPVEHAAWIAAVGLMFVLHFGVFRLLADIFHVIGIRVAPIMNCPIAARSLGDLWGTRWNRGFSVPARRYLFRPVARRFGMPIATMTVFAVSGLLHEIVISLPAGGEFGMPTVYFLIQGVGTVFEKRLGDRFLNRLFVIAVALLPLPLLLHDPFIHNVLIPFFAELGIMKGTNI